MMNAKITFTFDSDKTFEVIISKDALKPFLKAISQKDVYFDELGGFWLAFDKLMHFKIEFIGDNA